MNSPDLGANLTNTSEPKSNGQVLVHVYDITKGRARRNSFGLINGIWHTGVEVYGQEYFYCKHGILRCIPREYELAKYHHTIEMGESRLSEKQVEIYIEFFKASAFAGKHYGEITHNCNNFSDEMCKLLVGKKIPDKSILRF